AGRRQSRHVSPAPRSHHLELLPGTRRARDLVADVGAGLFAAEALHGRLDPASGDFEVGFAHGRRIVAGRLSERVGPFRLRGKVSAVLSRIVAVASDPVLSGAGWCAKGGQRLPVWSTTPAVLLAGVEVEAG
ncbi:MAG: metallopeptidase TldD-related protein, partial [Thermoanaerobaculia bacterium]|nr:metallopeptidase TldD-related protein [Thermoanaerobaculia bacterium]